MDLVWAFSSSRAWIRRPDSTNIRAREFQTAASTPLNFQNNPNNFYSSQWILGRMVMLLRDPDMNGDIFDDSNPAEKQYFIPESSGYDLAPLDRCATSNDPSSNTWEIQWSRYDLAGTTLQKFKTILTNAIAGGNADWFQDTTASGHDMMYRFQGSPFPTKPLTAAGLARVSPTLLQHCSQFIVEYAEIS